MLQKDYYIAKMTYKIIAMLLKDYYIAKMTYKIIAMLLKDYYMYIVVVDTKISLFNIPECLLRC